ncbi:hypothetical protein CTAYLR_004197 [Chrysophaeum taylorii]|uniref:U-box domain-containing protein n=1 Tax=Chrysophaeum taylorii TaxID=2483200 RepID=A0AAD7XR12_9STRA|nr:hypothetical protein CTAYLR_004197 [Chrysophaeum taylorii]
MEKLTMVLLWCAANNRLWFGMWCEWSWLLVVSPDLAIARKLLRFRPLNVSKTEKLYIRVELMYRTLRGLANCVAGGRRLRRPGLLREVAEVLALEIISLYASGIQFCLAAFVSKLFGDEFGAIFSLLSMAIQTVLKLLALPSLAYGLVSGGGGEPELVPVGEDRRRWPPALPSDGPPLTETEHEELTDEFPSLMCPICHGLVVEPVVCSGNTYDRPCIEKALENGGKDPTTGGEPSNLVPNYMLRSLIDTLIAAKRKRRAQDDEDEHQADAAKRARKGESSFSSTKKRKQTEEEEETTRTQRRREE